MTTTDFETRLAELEVRAGIGVTPLAANPPIQVGELTDVPAPGSPIASQWTQEVSGRIMHRFATAAARDAAFPSPVAGLRCYTQDLKREWRHDGTGWIIMAEPTSAYTPTVTGTPSPNVTGSTEHRSDGYCDVSILITLTGAVSAGPSVTLPYPAAFVRRGQFQTRLFGNSDLVGWNDDVGAGSTVMNVLYLTNSGGLMLAGAITPTVPFTWKSGDRIQITGRYQMSNVYQP